MTAYYNEFDPNAALWLQAAMDEGVIAKGVIDTRSIEDVRPDELIGFTQCHFFAGIGGWSIALRLAGWPDDKPVWTGSCPCQPFSAAGKGTGVNDPRHLWPAWFRLIQQRRPGTIFGEQVASAEVVGTQLEASFALAVQRGDYAKANGIANKLVKLSGFGFAKRWLDGVAHDLENEGYAVGSAIIPACSVGAPHRRDRLWFVGNAKGRGRGYERQNKRALGAEINPLANTSGVGDRGCMPDNRVSAPKHVAYSSEPRLERYGGHEPEHGAKGRQKPDGHFGEADLQWVNCPDGKARPVKSGLCLLADGIPAKLRKAALHGYGNAIVPQVAAEFIIASGFIAGGSQ